MKFKNIVKMKNNMDIKLKYRAWVGEKHADIANPLINSDIEKFAVEFAEWLVKNSIIPSVSNAEVESCSECGTHMVYDWHVEYNTCPKCGCDQARI